MSSTDTTRTADSAAQTDALRREEAAMTDALVTQADPWIDLQRASTESEYLMTALAQRYEAQMLPLLSGTTQDPQLLDRVLRILIRQLSRAQADIFALKSAVLGRDRLVLTRDWEFRDPLQSAQADMRDAFGMPTVSGTSRFSVPLDSTTMGYGWYAPEELNGAVWRWSGPGLTAGLMVPQVFDAPVTVEVAFSVLRRDVLPEHGGISVNGTPIIGSVVTDDTGLNGTITFPLDIRAEVSPFLMFVFEVLQTTSPTFEDGSKDSRELGICVRQIVISAAGEGK